MKHMSEILTSWQTKQRPSCEATANLRRTGRADDTKGRLRTALVQGLLVFPSGICRTTRTTSEPVRPREACDKFVPESSTDTGRKREGSKHRNPGGGGQTSKAQSYVSCCSCRVASTDDTDARHDRRAAELSRCCHCGVLRRPTSADASFQSRNCQR
jgi:hypothetical protein